MEHKQLIGAERHRRVGPTLVVAELNLVHTCCEAFDNRPDLATLQATVGEVI
jgi:hypothetical protein